MVHNFNHGTLERSCFNLQSLEDAIFQPLFPCISQIAAILNSLNSYINSGPVMESGLWV
jgi:hypothetical protein